MAKKKTKNGISVSVSEFKSWISGIEDMQEGDWVPNKVQWGKIKAKIELLSEDYVEPAPAEQYLPQLPQYQQPMPQYQQPVPTYSQPIPTYQQSSPMMSDITYTNGDSPDFL